MSVVLSFCRGSFTRDIVTPVLGVAGVGGMMAIYGAADSVVCAAVMKWYYLIMQAKQLSHLNMAVQNHAVPPWFMRVIFALVRTCMDAIVTYFFSLVYCFLCQKVHPTWQTVFDSCHVASVVNNISCCKSSGWYKSVLPCPLTVSAAVLLCCRQTIHWTPICGPIAEDRMLLPPGGHALQPRLILVRHTWPTQTWQWWQMYNKYKDLLYFASLKGYLCGAKVLRN